MCVCVCVTVSFSQGLPGDDGVDGPTGPQVGQTIEC